MLTVHHLGLSQSERIVWLCESLNIPYELKIYSRDPVTRLAPPEYKALHPLGTAPIITDGNVVLSETMAIVEYIFSRFGTGSLRPAPTAENFAEYLFWLHFANGTLQPALMRALLVERLDAPATNAHVTFTYARRDQALTLLENRVATTNFLAGEIVTTADIVTVFSLTTMRLFAPLDLSPYQGIRNYLRRIGEQESYQRAMAKSDPSLEPMLS